MPLTADREALCEHLERSRDEFTASIAGVSEAVWNFRPAPEAWSMAEVAEHVVISEAEILERVKRLTAGLAEPGRKPEVEGKDQVLIDRVPVRRGRAPAPEAMQPKSQFSTPSQAAEAFLEGRSRTLRYVHTSEADLRAHFDEHVSLKLLDAHQWLLLISVHTQRHVGQIAECRAAAESRTNA
jgi:hypothetical protein